MGVREVRRARAVRRICESAIASVAGGLILWSVTNSTSRSAPVVERAATVATSVVQSTATPAAQSITTLDTSVIAAIPPRETPGASLGTSLSLSALPTTSEARPRPETTLSIPVSIPGPTAATPISKKNTPPYFVPVGTVLLLENFSHCREGEPAGWGPNTFIKTGVDRRNWLVSNIDGTHPVGCRLQLPNEFYFECRYSADMPEITRGVFGWWKDPVTVKVSFLNDRGIRHPIEWVVKCGNDPTRLNPLGSSSLVAKKYYHTIKLPDGSTNEIGIIPPTGVLRIERDKNVLKVFMDGQAIVMGTTSPMGQLVGFEIDVVKATNGSMFFTDFKIAR